MERTKIDFLTTYKILNELSREYIDNKRRVSKDLIKSFMITEAKIAVELGRDKFKVVNIDYDLVDYKLCRRLAGNLQDFEEYLPYTLRRLATYWLDKYISVKVKDDE